MPDTFLDAFVMGLLCFGLLSGDCRGGGRGGKLLFDHFFGWHVEYYTIAELEGTIAYSI